ncbi:MAG: hypothetical protein JRH11_16150, partial [Deltaproteobacteria bacterium]|nr:hypothetical protein [Deltaproteobacteria bacterium]
AGGPFGRGLDVEGSATAEIHRALLDDNTDFAIFGAADAELHFTDLVVRNTRAQESDGSHGRALSLSQGASATVSRAVFEDNLEIGVFVQGEGTEATLEDTVVRRVTPGLRFGGAETGIGVTIEVGAAVTARGLRVEDCHFGGVVAQGDGSTFDGEDIVIDTIGPDGRGDLGIGLAVERGSTMRLARAVVRDTHTLGISVKDPGAHLVAEDVAIHGVTARVLDGELGAGLGMIRGARAEVTRIHIEGTSSDGLFASDVDTHLTLTDATIIRGDVSDTRGFGFLVRDGAVVDGTRIEILDMDEIGLLIGLGGAQVDLSDLVVRRVRERMIEEPGVYYAAGIQVETDATATLTRVLVDEVAHRGIASFGGTVNVIDGEVRDMVEDTPGELGYGIEAGPGAEMNLERVTVHEARAVGVVAFHEAHIVANGLVVTATRSSTVDGSRGRGIVAQGGGFIELTGVRIEGDREVGLLASGPDSRIDARDIVIRNILKNICGEEGSCSAGGGFGASAVGGTLALTGFLVEGGALGGLQITGGASVDLANGAIVNHPIGINIQDAPDYDFARLMNDVRFIDNQRNIDAAFIPLPDSDLGGLGLPATPAETPE